MGHKKDYPFPAKWRGSLPTISCIAVLTVFLCACNFASRLPAATSQPDLTSWTKTESPLFPLNWPPASDTVWVSYTFAYGSNPATLMDGAYVTNPLSKTEWKGGISTTTELSKEMTQAAIQGAIPLEDEITAILESEKQVSAFCLKLTELPDLNTPETKELLSYYHAWFKYNNAFLGLIRADHADFIDWVESK